VLVAVRVLVGTGLNYSTISMLNVLNDQDRVCSWNKGSEGKELTLLLKNDGNDQAIDTQDTSHNNWDNGLEDQLWLQDSHGRNTDSTLSSSVGGSEV